MSYHWIDLNTFPRRDHFAYFLTMENPIMNLTQDVDITEWNEKRRAKGLPFFLSFQYCMGQAANAVPAFRQRIRSGGIVEYDSCRCSYTVAAADGTFRYCVADTSLPFDRYLQEAQADQRVAEQEARLTDERRRGTEAAAARPEAEPYGGDQNRLYTNSLAVQLFQLLHQLGEEL